MAINKSLSYKLICFLYLNIIILNIISAQKNDYLWLFGYRSELIDCVYIKGYGGFDIDFNQNPFQISKHARGMHIAGNNASICDQDGQLQAYTNGCFISNKYDRRIKGSDSLFNYSRVADGNCYLGSPISKNCILLTDPKYSEYVHLFLIENKGLVKPGDSIHGMTYDKYILHTKIDLKANTGEAEVIYKNKVEIEDTLASYKMNACKHSDQQSWWLIFRKLLSHEFVRILMTEDTVLRMENQIMEPIKYNFWGNGSGSSGFSPNGKKYAWYDPYNDLNVYDFDRSTGLLSNYKKIVIQDSLLFGFIAFSPNSRFVYTTSRWDLYQTDLEEPDPLKAVTHISHYSGNLCPISMTSTAYFELQMGPDCKIYMNSPGTVTCLHVINHPDRKGKACDFVEAGVMLPSRHGNSIPNFPHYRIDNPYPCDSTIITSFIDIPNDAIRCNINPNPASEYLEIVASWNQYKYPILIVYNINGQQVKEFNLDHHLEKQKVNIANLPQGIYFYQILTESEWISTGRIVVE